MDERMERCRNVRRRRIMRKSRQRKMIRRFIRMLICIALPVGIILCRLHFEAWRIWIDAVLALLWLVMCVEELRKLNQLLGGIYEKMKELGN